MTDPWGTLEITGKLGEHFSVSACWLELSAGWELHLLGGD